MRERERLSERERVRKVTEGDQGRKRQTDRGIKVKV